MKPLLPVLFAHVVILAAQAVFAQQPDIPFADFEGDEYGDWVTTGTAFGSGPARGTLPNQMPVSGFKGERLVNSFRNGDGTTGTLTSPEFKLQRKYIAFLIGGGGFEGRTCMNLMVDGKVVRTATGPNTQPGGSEQLEPNSWDVAEFLGKMARIQIVDDATGGWGHINVDHIVFTDTMPPSVRANAKRELVAEKRYVHFPVKHGAAKRHVTVSVDGRAERKFDIELADAAPDWWAWLDIGAWKGRGVAIQVDRLPGGSQALDSLEQGDSIKGCEGLYREPLRPQFHFSSRTGWNNDPNGLVFFGGDYHLFYQHNPYGWNWGNMHWGHAVSRDLVHWTELGEALYPDELGPMFSGSAVVDWKNASGFGKDGRPPIVLIYTAAGNPAVQCLAYSTDNGRKFTKYTGNPVVKNISPGNRDPKVLWHEPTQRWVMTLYVGLTDESHKDDQGRPATKHTIHFLTSPDLRVWTVTSHVDGFYECPDFFELAVDVGQVSNLPAKPSFNRDPQGSATNGVGPGIALPCGSRLNKPVEAGLKSAPRPTKWVLTAASSEYMLGTFDGEKFTPETPKLPGHRGRGFYAAQTFSDIPAGDGRRIQIGWLQAPAPGMPFNQCMSVPLELQLRDTADGPRLAWQPVKELDTLRNKSHRFGPLTVLPGDANPAAGIAGEVLEVRAEFEPGDGAEIGLTVRGTPVRYDANKQELAVFDHRAPAPLRNGRQRLIILADRTSIEVFASDGLTYVPFPVIPKAEDQSVVIDVRGGTVQMNRLEVHELQAAWATVK